MAHPPKRPPRAHAVKTGGATARARDSKGNVFIERAQQAAARNGKKQKYTITDEERERRRERMKKLRAEGRVGPQFGKLGGRPRQPRMAEVVAEEMRREINTKQVIRALKDGLDPNIANLRERRDTAIKVLEIEREERKLEMAEERDDFDKMDRSALLVLLAQKLSGNQAVAQLDVGDTISGTAQDIAS